MNYSLILLLTGILSLLAGNASSRGCEDNIVFDGKGAGQVVFSVSAHTAKGISCADCHEGSGFSFALFDMKIGADAISMRKMQLGSSCGHCHNGKNSGKNAFSVTNTLNCSKCHHKT
ncbi:MAG: c(7)-type cytochrome triheme domain-containing protein [Nitrospirota bacterium]